MKARPILFSAPMVNALIGGRKTQTRRILNGSLHSDLGGHTSFRYRKLVITGGIEEVTSVLITHHCPYGKLGDLLWVRETFRLSTMDDCACYEPCGCISGVPIYLAQTGQQCDEKWKPSIFMPRWASRLTLRIKSVRLERLNDISEQDAIAEGIDRWDDTASITPYRNYRKGSDGEMNLHCSCPERSFMTLWESINGADSWKANPWVWVIEFEVIQKNVDKFLEEAA